MKTRQDRLMPDGVLKYVRCYDSGEDQFDRYTVVFTGRYPGRYIYLGMSEHPTHPQGFGQHGESPSAIDRPNYGRLGKRIKFDDLPEDCKTMVRSDYKDIWSL